MAISAKRRERNGSTEETARVSCGATTLRLPTVAQDAAAREREWGSEVDADFLASDFSSGIREENRPRPKPSTRACHYTVRNAVRRFSLLLVLRHNTNRGSDYVARDHQLHAESAGHRYLSDVLLPTHRQSAQSGLSRFRLQVTESPCDARNSAPILSLFTAS